MVWNCLVAASNLAAVFTCGERYEASILSGDPMAPSMAPSSTASSARTPAAHSRATSPETAPFPDLGRVSGGAMAIKRPGQRALLVLSWEVLIQDALAEARQKPLDLLGHTLTEPHAHSLAALLRVRGLSPLAIELEPVVTAKTVARADGWQIWALES